MGLKMSQSGSGSLIMVLIDTHIAVYLYMDEKKRISRKAQALLETQQIILPQMARLELDYLYEVGRISEKSETIVGTLFEDIDLQLSNTRFHDIVSEAKHLNWTRDPFDRLICADALVLDAALVTKDKNIREQLATAVWD